MSTCDPFFSNVVLLLNSSGAGGATVFTDDSLIGNPITTHDSAIVDNTNEVFAGFPVMLVPNLAAGSITAPDGTDFDLQTGDFTIDFWFWTDTPGAGPYQVFSKIGFTSVYPFEFTFGGVMAVNGADNIGTTQYTLPSAITMPANTWQLFSLERFGDIMTLFQNGVAMATVTMSPGQILGGNADPITLGLSVPGSGIYRFFDARITKGVARYGGVNYALPTEPYGLACATDVTVPDVTGEVLATAEANITGATLVVGTVTTAHNGIVPAGSVISQNPVGFTVVDSGTSVDLVESLGPAAFNVPNIVNTSLSIATSLLIAAGYVLGTVTYASSSLYIKGNVAVQNPVAGTAVAEGSPVDVVISTGRDGVQVPDLTGLTDDQARQAVLDVGLVVNTTTTAPSLTVPAGQVVGQNPPAGAFVASGSFVSYVLSSGPLTDDDIFDFEQTVISQYANSPTLLQLLLNFNGYLNQNANFAQFYTYIWNLDTAVGFGLDILGKIIGVPRLLRIPSSPTYFGFKDGTTPGDWKPFNEAPFFSRAANSTQSYLLDDDSYRRLIFTKALSNIASTTAPALNRLLMNLFPGRGNAYAKNLGGMAMQYTFDFELTPIELAILEQSNAVPGPVGVAISISSP